jgi:hypothetical protein
MRNSALLVVLGLLFTACSGSSPDEDQVWDGDSAGINFVLTGPVAQRLCEFSARRAELTATQLDGLAALRLRDGTGGAGCDVPAYTVTIQAGDGSLTQYQATEVVCSTLPILLFDDFDAWAKSTPCSLEP